MIETLSTKYENSDDISQVICNPIYTGIGEFPRAISDEQWIKAAKIAMGIDDEHHFLMNLSSSLEASFGVQFIGRNEWVKEIEVLLEKHDVKKVLVNLLEFLREFFKKEVVNKDMGKFYKKWLITTPIAVVIIQNINIFRIVLNIRICESSNSESVTASAWVLKSSKTRFLNLPIVKIELLTYHRYFCILKVGEYGKRIGK